jgi:hypothetical protein
MSLELNDTIQNVKTLANTYIEEMYWQLLTLQIYPLQHDNIHFIVSEVGRNYVFLNTNPFYKWLLEQPLSIERTNALAFMWRHSFLKKLDNLNIIWSTIINRQITLSIRKHLMMNQYQDYNKSSSDWISNYIKHNTPYICDYIEAGNVSLK